MDVDRMKRKDTTRGPPLRVLSLDGGGVRGYSMLIIIQELMHRTYVEIEGKAPRRDQIPRPCDHFDLIVGTGTGGLIALMLGRLRLNLEQCKELYVRMTRMVFQTDKTIAGIPYRSTLFKASMLEHAIKEAVREHTVSETEGNDGTPTDPRSPASIASRSSAGNLGDPRRLASNASTVSFSARSPTAQMARPAYRGGYGDPNARLYDSRENRTKTAVTAIYKGTPKGGDPAVLRSYDSRKELSPEPDVKIWEAGRATCAIGLAFKPIRVGQSIFHDDGAGTFNPSPFALEEATVHEWPGRDVGVFLSIGTGRRPRNTDGNSHVWYEGFMGDFAEARRKLIAKIEGCEVIHERMMKELLPKRGVNIENYYRLNVEVGVGEFAMNEWHRLGDISTGTRRYLGRPAEQKMVQESSAKLAKIHRAKQRWERMSNTPNIVATEPMESISQPLAVELMGDIPAVPLMHVRHEPLPRQSYDSGIDRLSLPGSDVASMSPPRTSGDRSRPSTGHPSPQPAPARLETMPETRPLELSSGDRPLSVDGDRLLGHAPTPAQYRHASGSDKIAIMSPDEQPRRHPMQDKAQPPPPSQTQTQTRPQQHQPHRIEQPPPLPPKTPLPEHQNSGAAAPPARRTTPTTGTLPYPLDDAPPPVVNMARKPDLRNR
ncbi:acyl transferase/acyl hydrolase/lysophospholipase [Microdochium trichocladiopsis]|uniref:Acyl transferase/acyl hydrolase/lysophospholipase n=1 Tax=Microdochium trichocladiopsis TaxID=1682393 RepID=A0A9P8XZ91_9PEZI|nr:acyl transferase/acyl hydrolase/lysophospholipase [Microdochium trichocladiopsis]KAH7025894.1 acyl transferase/acyl hydrolase/lysophospholipase [Microdochium trichocladiopsis]